MDPFSFHAQRSPDCKFVQCFKQSIGVSSLFPSHPQTTDVGKATTNSSEQDKPSQCQKIEVANGNSQVPALVEVEMIKQVRRRTFSHWPHRSSPFQTQMIQAGFFYCSVGDRVICIYCNLICQQWTPHTDDPCEVHKTFSPKCPFVVNMLVRREVTPLLIINQSIESNRISALATGDLFRSHEIVLATACNPAYVEIPRRHQSFTSWPSEQLPSVDDL
ncbi:unnamed protein product, partial [Rotaria sp. Silwood2]